MRKAKLSSLLLVWVLFLVFTSCENSEAITGNISDDGPKTLSIRDKSPELNRNLAVVINDHQGQIITGNLDDSGFFSAELQTSAGFWMLSVDNAQPMKIDVEEDTNGWKNVQLAYDGLRVEVGHGDEKGPVDISFP